MELEVMDRLLNLPKTPVIMACKAVIQYQTIISRNIGAQDISLLTVGSVQAGTDNNVIPSSAVIKINLRWFNEKTRNVLLDGIARINEGIAVANGLSKEQYPSIKMKGNFTPLENSVPLTNKINTALQSIIEPEKIITTNLSAMSSEDFQKLVTRRNNNTPYNYLKVGIVNPATYAKAIEEGKKAPFFHHAGNYVVDLRAIPFGTEIGATALLTIFNK